MSDNRIIFEGLEELKRELANLPAHLAEQARSIVSRHATNAQARIDAEYERKGNDLGRFVKVSHENGPVVSSSRVYATSKLNSFFEYGTHGRSRKTAKGYNRGPLPARPTMVPIIQQERRAMYEDLAAMLRENGLEVSG